ncbi:MAG: anti-sigma factor [Phycisphaerales bacterium]|nr:anti-sigma factor [Phycisphaerales bacterium]
MSHALSEHDRLLELLADEELGQLSLEDRAELEVLREKFGPTGTNVLGELLVAFDSVDRNAEKMPAALAAALTGRGHTIVAGEPAGRIGRPRRGLMWLSLVAAAVAVAVSVGVAVRSVQERSRSEASWRQQLAAAQQQLGANDRLLADARAHAEELARTAAEKSDLTESQAKALAAAAAREVDLAQRLASASADLSSTRAELDRSRLEIAKYEEPADPAELAENRELLLRVPDTVRLAWQPFNLDNAPAPIGGVQGDVVWNDKLQEGYLRFVGLPVNDPKVQQYQVWVIDDRGMEQKVSGGVFNATAAGEVIVPVRPGIDVGRVALFAVTVENPGGTWVPDLKRRVVVAPREEG